MRESRSEKLILQAAEEEDSEEHAARDRADDEDGLGLLGQGRGPFDFLDVVVKQRGGIAVEAYGEGIEERFAYGALKDAVVVSFDGDMAGVFEAEGDFLLDGVDVLLVRARRGAELRGEKSDGEEWRSIWS